MSEDLLSMLSIFFNGIWSGLQNTNIPGTSWPIGDFFVALFTAGVIGLILKWIFKVFNTHFGRGFGGAERRRADWRDLNDD